ncbi:MAG: hypothetical protein U0802_10790 [Candidatus Binatia bacterium]
MVLPHCGVGGWSKTGGVPVWATSWIRKSTAILLFTALLPSRSSIDTCVE